MKLVAASIAVALLASGCGLLAGAIGPPADDFSEWSAVPLAPDPALTAEAQQTCHGGPDLGRPLPFLFQDRRTPQSAIVVFGDADEYQACWASHGGGGGFGTGGTEIDDGGLPPLTIGFGRSGIGGIELVQVDGNVVANAAFVQVVRDDGLVVEASLGGGRWLAWWPGDLGAVRAVAYDVNGAELARAEPKL